MTPVSSPKPATTVTGEKEAAAADGYPAAGTLPIGNCNDAFEHRYLARFQTAAWDPATVEPWLRDAVLEGRQATPSGHQWYNCRQCRAAWRFE